MSNKVFTLNDDLPHVCKTDTPFTLVDGYYVNENETVFIKQCDSSDKLFSTNLQEKDASK